jgi:23S rRNA (adenine2503-C2)-methyltransferase
MKHKIFKSSDTNVSKFVFEKESTDTDKAIAVEAVLYRYETYKERTVICCSTQCGCPVGCTFCGTGKFFVRNLTTAEIIEQVDTVLGYIDCPTKEIKKFQIMFMSMGEPFLNYKALEETIIILADKYPNAQLLVSTSGPLGQTFRYFDKFIELSTRYKQVGIQFSVHESNDDARSRLIPTATLKSVGYLGEKWAEETGRKPFFNYCVHEGNATDSNIVELLENFNPAVWECTLSVICEKDNSMKNEITKKIDLIRDFSERMIKTGYSIRIFNPAGQDDIGGGCGQLWYFQEWLNEKKGTYKTFAECIDEPDSYLTR